MPYRTLLMDYAAGTLDESLSLLVSVHVRLSPQAARLVERYETLGGAFLEECCPEPLSSGVLQSVLARISGESCWSPLSRHGHGPLPEFLCSCLRGEYGSEWAMLCEGVLHRILPVEPVNGFPVRLVRMDPGGVLPGHAHEDPEITLVLDGAFRDETGFYRRGDLIVMEASTRHEPRACERLGCVLLNVATDVAG